MTGLNVHKSSGESARVPADREAYHWVHWDPFRQMSPFLPAEEQQTQYLPSFEVKETKEGFVFKADVPGLQESDLEITMTGNRLTISGKRDAPKQEASDTYYSRECSYGAFSRAFTLPEGTEPGEAIHADLAQGVLTLTLPKKPEHQPRRIQVQGPAKATV